MQASAVDSLMWFCSVGQASVGSHDVKFRAFAMFDGVMDLSQVGVMMQRMNGSSEPCRGMQSSALPLLHRRPATVPCALSYRPQNCDMLRWGLLADLPCCMNMLQSVG